LDSLNLVVDADLLSLCCEWCNIGVLPNHVQGHLKNTHKRSIKIDDHQFHQVLEEMDVMDGFPEYTGPSINEDARSPFAGERK
jgi:hypothetical protein